MPLTDAAVRNAKPGPKPSKLSNSKGMFLLVQPSGAKLWRFKYRVDGREKKLSLGTYPEVSLREARRRCEEARAQHANGIDPAEARKVEHRERDEKARNSFGILADEYLEKMERDERAAVTIKKSRWLVSLMLPDLARRPVSEIKPAELLQTLKKVETKGTYEVAKRMRSLASRIFRYAVATGRAENDPAAVLIRALATRKVRHHSAILDPLKVGALLRAIDGYEGHPLTQLALRLTPHVFVRPGELRRAEWAEFDLEKAIWTIPAAKMKMRSPHHVPLSKQAIEILKSANVFSDRQQYVFSSLYPGNRPMSENTINAALRRLGYTGAEMTAHGFRAMASTLLNESGEWNPDAIERALAHADTNAIRASYHRGQHWNERVRMAQWWSDYLDRLRAA